MKQYEIDYEVAKFQDMVETIAFEKYTTCQKFEKNMYIRDKYGEYYQDEVYPLFAELKHLTSKILNVDFYLHRYKREILKEIEEKEKEENDKTYKPENLLQDF